jgi:hypothetical protein
VFLHVLYGFLKASIIRVQYEIVGNMHWASSYSSKPYIYSLVISVLHIYVSNACCICIYVTLESGAHKPVQLLGARRTPPRPPDLGGGGFPARSAVGGRKDLASGRMRSREKGREGGREGGRGEEIHRSMRYLDQKCIAMAMSAREAYPRAPIGCM